MNLKYIDNHAHLNLSDFDSDIDDVIKRAKELGVGIINVGVDYKSSKKAIELAEQNESMWAIVGQHPTDTKEDFNIDAYLEFLKSKKVVAIGECGLDYFHLKDGNKEDQKELFKRQIELALEFDLPLMLHVRDAYEDVLEILNLYSNNKSLRGNVHFFAGGVDVAERFIELGFSMSFTGAITYASNYEEVIKFIPIDRILSETDCPFVAPIPYRGKRNEPAYVIEVVKKISEIKGLDFNEVSKKLLENSRRLFNLSLQIVFDTI